MMEAEVVMIIGSERKPLVEKKVRPVALQPSSALSWLKDQLTPPKILTREERRAKAKRDGEFHNSIKSLWED